MKCRYLAHLCLPLWLCAIGACGGGSSGPNHVENPMAAPGGGVQEGAIHGELNVFVIDADDAPVAGAMVRVGDAAAAAPLTGTTDASGLVTFEDDTLKGAQTITVTASGFAAQTWIGANGAVVTIPLTSTGAPATPPSTRSPRISRIPPTASRRAPAPTTSPTTPACGSRCCRRAASSP
jgi:hypothetical protein